MMTLFFHKFLTHRDFNVDMRIIFTSYCRVRNQKVIATGNIAIIAENEAALNNFQKIFKTLCRIKISPMELF